MKIRHWICFTAILMLARLLLDIGFGMDRYTKFPSWQWHLGFVLRNAGAILLLLLGNFVGMKHFSAVCYDRKNRLLQIGKLELWFYGLNKNGER